MLGGGRCPDVRRDADRLDDLRARSPPARHCTAATVASSSSRWSCTALGATSPRRSRGSCAASPPTTATVVSERRHTRASSARRLAQVERSTGRAADTRRRTRAHPPRPRAHSCESSLDVMPQILTRVTPASRRRRARRSPRPDPHAGQDRRTDEHGVGPRVRARRASAGPRDRALATARATRRERRPRGPRSARRLRRRVSPHEDVAVVDTEEVGLEPSASTRSSSARVVDLDERLEPELPRRRACSASSSRPEHADRQQHRPPPRPSAVSSMPSAVADEVLAQHRGVDAAATRRMRSTRAAEVARLGHDRDPRDRARRIRRARAPRAFAREGGRPPSASAP